MTMRLQPAFQDHRRRDGVDSRLLFAASDGAREPMLGLEARQTLIVKLNRKTKGVGKLSREVARVTSHRSLAAIHVEWQPDDETLDRAASEGVSDSFEIRLFGSTINRAKWIRGLTRVVAHSDAYPAGAQIQGSYNHDYWYT